MSFIRTVLGDIDPASLGVCYAHEHVIIDPGYMTAQFPELLLDNVENAVTELRQFHADGGRAMIDSMPAGGRNPAKLAEISRRTGVHLVCPTGLHLKKYYPLGHWGKYAGVEKLADAFVREIEHGIDGLPVRAGVIKVAGEIDGVAGGRAQRIFGAAARAHRLTGCPILTHTEGGDGAPEQVELLRALGVPPRHIVLSHTDRRPDVEAHRLLLQSGVHVEFDSAFRWKDTTSNPTLDLLRALYDEFPTQLLLGMDAAKSAYWRSYGGAPGLSYLLTDFSRHLSPEMRHQIFVVNPARAYAFTSPCTP